MKHLKTYQEHSSTFTHQDKEYDLNKMFRLTKRRKISKMNVSKLKWILKYSKIYKYRVAEADTNVPILIGKMGKKWVVYDGAHRLTKAIKQGDETIKVIKVPAYILKKCLISEEK